MPYPFAGRYYNKNKNIFSYEYKDYTFKVDLEFGELLFNRQLISLSGKHLSLNLSLNYIQRHVDDGGLLLKAISTGLYLDADDDHNNIFSWIMNNCWWFY